MSLRMVPIFNKSPTQTPFRGKKSLLIIVMEEYESIEYRKNESTTS